jgi:hypothetical protein
MMFDLWPLDKVTDAIVFLEEGLAKGFASVSTPAQGSVAYSTPTEAKKTLIALYRRYYALTGFKPTGGNKPRIFAMRRMEEY